MLIVVSYVNLLPIILSGGVGKRLWPLSRTLYPKPFIELDSGENLLQRALLRAQALPGVDRVLTVTRCDLYARTVEAYLEVRRAGLALDYVLEPVGRDTAPAVAAAALVSARTDDNTLLLFLTADHVIDNNEGFARAVRQACQLADESHIVTFGIQPDRPEVSYGYIEADGSRVRRFVEKPDRTTAQRYLADGNFLWNSGMLCARASTLLRQLDEHAPVLLQQVRDSLPPAEAAHQPIILDAARYGAISPISIDYALLEKSSQVAVVPCDLGWNDVGNWNTIAERQAPDGDGNRTHGETVLQGARNCYVHAEDRLVAVAGVEGLTIVDTPDALLVIDTQQPRLVEQIVASLQARGHRSCFELGVVYCPTEADTALETEVRHEDLAADDVPGSYTLRRKTLAGAGLDWTDVELWNALAEQRPADANGNRVDGEVVLNQVCDCTIHSTDRLVAAAGVSQLTIVDTPDALLVIDTRQLELIQPILKTLRARGHTPHPSQRTVYRTWGTYTVLEAASNFKIKRLRVKPGASLSLQKHQHRSEHWVVLDGTAKVVNGEQEMLIERNQSAYIPAGSLHRLSNPGQRDLVMIEVQSGPYLEEDDIVRFNAPPA